MMTFYAAAGRYRVKREDGHTIPYIQKLGKLHPVSIPEFVIWSSLLWEVMTYDELKHRYEESIRGIDVQFPGFDELLDMLLKRKLIIKGMGYTGMDALFNMLSDAFVIPYSVPIPKKAWTLLRLIAQGKLHIMELIHLQRNHSGTADEDRVIRLIEQTPLSTAELIRCFERGIYDVSTPEKVIDGLYPDEEQDQSRIAREGRLSACSGAVLDAVANLYLKHRIILEVV